MVENVYEYDSYNGRVCVQILLPYFIRAKIDIASEHVPTYTHFVQVKIQRYLLPTLFSFYRERAHESRISNKSFKRLKKLKKVYTVPIKMYIRILYVHIRNGSVSLEIRKNIANVRNEQHRGLFSFQTFSPHSHHSQTISTSFSQFFSFFFYMGRFVYVWLQYTTNIKHDLFEEFRLHSLFVVTFLCVFLYRVSHINTHFLYTSSVYNSAIYKMVSHNIKYNLNAIM